jgi:hypothetical protein
MGRILELGKSRLKSNDEILAAHFNMGEFQCYVIQDRFVLGMREAVGEGQYRHRMPSPKVRQTAHG